jgi:hypothetical protein
MAILNLDKTKQREIRNAVIVGVAASASTTVWDAVQSRVPALAGENTELFKALGGAVLLGVAPRRSGLAKDLVENIGLGMIVSGTLNFAAQPVTNLLQSIPGLSGYAPRHQLAAPALGAYAPRSVIGGGILAADTQPVI